MKIFKSLGYALGFLSTIGIVAAIADYTVTQGSGSTVFSFVCSTTKICPAFVLIDSTNVEKGTSANPLLGSVSQGGNTAIVKPASTAAVATDPALVVTMSPNGLNTNGQKTMANSAPVVIASDQSVLSTQAASLDPCTNTTQTYTPISIISSTTTRIITPVSAKKTYICYMFIFSNGTNNVGVVEGTGGTCGSGTAGIIGGTTAANGPNLVAQAGFSIGNGGSTVVQTAGTNVDFCLITSTATSIAGGVKWVQAP